MTSSPRSLEVPANGLVHHVVEWLPDGDPEATAVLVHGFMDAAGTWDLVAPALVAAKMRVLAPDMRGFGQGPRAPAGSYYHFSDYVADLAAILDALGVDRVFLVGHSMGGTISSYYAGARPEKVAKLALLEGVGPPDHAHEIAPDRMARWLVDLRSHASRAAKESAPMSKDDALRRLTLNHPRVPIDILRTRLPHLTYERDGAVYWRFDPLHKTTAPVPFFAKSYVAFASRVTCPVLFIGGGPLGFHPPDEAERLAAFANVTHHELPEGGHMMHWTKSGEVADSLVSFWRSASRST